MGTAISLWEEKEDKRLKVRKIKRRGSFRIKLPSNYACSGLRAKGTSLVRTFVSMWMKEAE